MRKILLFGILFIISSCGNKNQHSSTPDKNENKKVAEHKEPTLPNDIKKSKTVKKTPVKKEFSAVVTEKSIGILKLGDLVSIVPKGLTMKKGFFYAEGDKYDKFLFYKDKELLFETFPGDNNKIVVDIIIHSPKFKTSEGFGVGSTLSDLIKGCKSKYSLFYTYVSQRFIFSCNNKKHIQFIINPKQFKKPAQLASPKFDSQNLHLNQFQKDAKIVNLRIY